MRVSILTRPSAIYSRLPFRLDRKRHRPSNAKKDLVELHDGSVVEKSFLEESSADVEDWDLASSGDDVCRSPVGLNVVLVHPQIPQNTGCTARSCAAACVPLHLVEPLGFDTDSKKLKRGGLDFWPYVVVKVHSSWQAFANYFRELESPKRMVGFTKYGKTDYWEPAFRYCKGDWLIFGSETTGLPAEAWEDITKDGAFVKIPMLENRVRCLNLSVSVGVGLYEAKRQLELQ